MASGNLDLLMGYATRCSYDEDGCRVKKQSGTAETLYYRNGGTLLTQKTGNDRMEFLYAEKDFLIGFRDNGKSY